jgi:hypothetical protein
LGIDDRVWSATIFSKNRDRLLRGDVAQGFFEAVRLYADRERLLSTEHFTVDGTLLETWASSQELPAARRGFAIVRRRQCQRRLSWPAPDERHPSIDYRPGCPAA